MVDPEELNIVVREALSQHLTDTYRLAERGQALVQEANNSLSAPYAHQHRLPVDDGCFRDILQKLVTRPPRNYDTVLDVCSGTGYIALNIMRKKLFRHCVAIDLNQSALRMLTQRAQEERITGIEIRHGDVMATDFPDASFDCIFGNAFLHHLPDNEKFLTEMHRILKPEGVLCFTHEPSVTAVHWENLILGKLRFGKPAPRPLTDVWQYRQETIAELLHRTGYRDVHIEGRGRWASALETALDRICLRLFRRPPPAWLWRSRSVFYRLEAWLAPARSVDDCSSLSITARKEGAPT